jgi:hypothetical protein
MRFLADAPSSHDTFPDVEVTIAQCTPTASGVRWTRRWVARRALGVGLILQRWLGSVLPPRSEAPPEPPELSHMGDSEPVQGEDESSASPRHGIYAGTDSAQR